MNLDNFFGALLKYLKEFFRKPHPSGNGGSRVLVFRQNCFAGKHKWHTDICVLREYQTMMNFFF